MKPLFFLVLSLVAFPGSVRANSSEKVPYKEAVKICTAKAGLTEEACLARFQGSFTSRIVIPSISQKAADACFYKGESDSSIDKCIWALSRSQGQFNEIPNNVIRLCTSYGENGSSTYSCLKGFQQNGAATASYDDKMIKFCSVFFHKGQAIKCVKLTKNQKLSKNLAEQLLACAKNRTTVDERCFWSATTILPEELGECRRENQELRNLLGKSGVIMNSAKIVKREARPHRPSSVREEAVHSVK